MKLRSEAEPLYGYSVSPFPATTPSEFDLNERKDWLVDGILGQGDISVFFGEPGATKSLLAVNLACHLDVGLPWFGRKVQPCGVVYVASERAKTVRARIRAFAKETCIVTENIALIESTVDLVTNRDGANALCENVWDAAEYFRTPVELIVIDTLSRSLVGGDENSSVDMGRVVMHLEHLKQRSGCHILLIAHSPLTGDARPRGHSSLLGAVDTTVQVRQLKSGCSAKIIKNNDGPTGTTLHYKLKSVVLHTAEDGSQTNAPHIVEMQGNLADVTVTEIPEKALSNITVSALKILTDLISSEGVPRPEANGGSAVKTSLWRDACYAEKDWKDVSIEAKKKRFKRAREALVAAGEIASTRTWVWEIQKGTNGDMSRDNDNSVPSETECA